MLALVGVRELSSWAGSSDFTLEIKFGGERAGQSGSLWSLDSHTSHPAHREVRGKWLDPPSLGVLSRLEEGANSTDFTGCPFGAGSRGALGTVEERCAGCRFVCV